MDTADNKRAKAEAVKKLIQQETYKETNKNIQLLNKSIKILNKEINNLKGDKSILEWINQDIDETSKIENTLLWCYGYTIRVKKSLEAEQNIN